MRYTPYTLTFSPSNTVKSPIQYHYTPYSHPSIPRSTMVSSPSAAPSTLPRSSTTSYHRSPHLPQTTATFAQVHTSATTMPSTPRPLNHGSMGTDSRVHWMYRQHRYRLPPYSTRYTARQASSRQQGAGRGDGQDSRHDRLTVKLRAILWLQIQQRRWQVQEWAGAGWGGWARRRLAWAHCTKHCSWAWPISPAHAQGSFMTGAAGCSGSRQMRHDLVGVEAQTTLLLGRGWEESKHFICWLALSLSWAQQQIIIILAGVIGLLINATCTWFCSGRLRILQCDYSITLHRYMNREGEKGEIDYLSARLFLSCFYQLPQWAYQN